MNIIFKGLLIISAIFVSSLIGYNAGMKYKKREALLRDILLFCDYLISDIGFLQNKLKDNIIRLKELLGAEINLMLDGFISVLELPDAPDISLLQEYVPKAYLKSAEYSRFLQLLLVLGTSDAQTQICSISSFRESFEPNHSEAMSETKKYTPMYSKLGVLIGIGIGIVLL